MALAAATGVAGVVEGPAPESFAVAFSPPEPAAAEAMRGMRQASREAAELAAVVIDYPLEDSIFPRDSAAPTILWHDGSQRADRWLVELAFGGGSFRVIAPVEAGPPPRGEIDPRCVSPTNEPPEPTPYQRTAKAWRPAPALWERY